MEKVWNPSPIPWNRSTKIMESIPHSMDSIWINPGRVKYWSLVIFSNDQALLLVSTLRLHVSLPRGRLVTLIKSFTWVSWSILSICCDILIHQFISVTQEPVPKQVLQVWMIQSTFPMPPLQSPLLMSMQWGTPPTHQWILIMKKTLCFKYGVATEMPTYTTIILHMLIQSNYATFIWKIHNRLFLNIIERGVQRLNDRGLYG